MLERWTPPEAENAVRLPTHDDRQFWLNALQYGEYRYDRRSPEWFGYKIADRLGVNKDDAKRMQAVMAVLDDLIDEGTFRIETRKDEQRRPRQFVVPGVLAGVENR